MPKSWGHILRHKMPRAAALQPDPKLRSLVVAAMRVIISGGVGFVGSHFANHLIRHGHKVTVVDINERGLVPWGQQYEWVVDDLRRFVTIRNCDDFDLIIHCAAVVGGRLKIEGDPLAVATNLAVDASLFNWIARGKKPKRVIYFSSSAVYPIELQERNRHCALSEALVDLNRKRFGLPDQTYGFAKFAGELLAKQAVEKYGVDVVIYRPFSGYGTDQALDYPFPSIIQRVKNREDPIVIWGSGDQERDFIHIDDIVEAVLATYDKLKPGSTLNLGTGIGTSFYSLAREAAGIAGYFPEIVTDKTKPEGVFSRIADTFLLEQYYRPKISLAEGIKRALTPQKS